MSFANIRGGGEPLWTSEVVLRALKLGGTINKVPVPQRGHHNETKYQ